MRRAALLILGLAVVSPASVAAIYTCTDANGNTVFRDVPCARGERRAEAPAAKRSRADAPKKQTAAGQPLERAQVERLLKRLEQAMSKRDTKAVVALLAKDASVQWVVAGASAANPALDRAGYENYLRQVFARPDYAYQRRGERISLSKRKPRATVTRTLREAVLVDGRLQPADVKERLVIEPDGKRLVLRSIRKSAQPLEPLAAGTGDRLSAR